MAELDEEGLVAVRLQQCVQKGGTGGALLVQNGTLRSAHVHQQAQC